MFKNRVWTIKKRLCLLLTLLWVVSIHALDAQQNYQELLGTVMEGKAVSDNSLLIRLNGDTTYYADLKGEWILLDYWSATCIPCIKEMPFIKALQERYPQTGLKVVMINLDKKEKRWKRGIRLYHPPQPHYRTDRNLRNPFFAINLVELQGDGKQILSTLVPQYVLIAPDGTIMDKKMPKPSDKEFNARIEKHRKTYSQKLENQ